MAKVLISFIGKPDPKVGYRPAIYDFRAEAGGGELSQATPLFGAALLTHLRRRSNPPSRWLVLGTAQSIWDALAEALPEELRGDEEVRPRREEIHAAVEAGNVNPDQLKLWEEFLGERLNVECHCEIVGSGDCDEDQQRIWSAIDAHVDQDDQIVMDVTHAFRSLPILASFMVMYLRWLKGVKDVDLVYGAFGMGEDKNITPVVHLPLCQKLLEASEAVAILRHTGNYVPLAAAARLDSSVQRAVALHAFLDEVQPVHGATCDVLATLPSPTAAPEVSLVKRLSQAIQVSARKDLPRRMRDRAKRALNQGHYQQAALLLYEAILEAGIPRFTHEAPGTHAGRDAAERGIRSWVAREKLGRTFWDLNDVRNAAAHGSKQKYNSRVQSALDDPAAFEKLFADGLKLLDRLLEVAEGRPR